MCRFLLPGRGRRLATIAPCWLAPLLLLTFGGWGIGTALLLFSLLTIGVLLALLVAAGLLDFAAR